MNDCYIWFIYPSWTEFLLKGTTSVKGIYVYVPEIVSKMPLPSGVGKRN
jgi:hypothetical protein